MVNLLAHPPHKIKIELFLWETNYLPTLEDRLAVLHPLTRFTEHDLVHSSALCLAHLIFQTILFSALRLHFLLFLENSQSLFCV